MVITEFDYENYTQEQLIDRIKQLEAALFFYANPESYFAIFIQPDRPSGFFADDFGCCASPADGFHDHRPGRLARKMLGNEWDGNQVCDEMKDVLLEQADDFEEVIADPRKWYNFDAYTDWAKDI